MNFFRFRAIVSVMTPNQEDALFDFLVNVTEPFTLEDVTAFIHILEPWKDNRLSAEIAAMIDARNIAFRLNKRQWVSRRGCFEPAPFVIKPSRLELLNGILIPGHRCVPFVNPGLLPHEYKFFWKGAPIPATTTEGPPEDLYPYYIIFGEEYAPQFIAEDNYENAEAFNCDPYEDPPEVSIHTFDMRNIYRETSFVPGDQFVVHTADWLEGRFELEKVNKDQWSQADLYSWLEAAESGFLESFSLLGPGISIEEQIAYAYWYGGKRMRDVPAFSLEEFIYEKTDKIEPVPYGIETRFWFAGKEIPDSKCLIGFASPPDRTIIEDILADNNIPVSEYVLLSYIRDALFRGETGISDVILRIIPQLIRPDKDDWELIEDFLTESMEDMSTQYWRYADQGMGPIRQRAAELHTAVIELSVRLQKSEIDLSRLPTHTFIILSQIQGHAAALLEDLDTSELPADYELDAQINSLDSMVETYKDIKELIEDAIDNFRRNNLSLVSARSEIAPRANFWLAVQIGVSGTDVWRRAFVPESFALEELHRLIQAGMDWHNTYQYRFSHADNGRVKNKLLDNARVGELYDEGISELLYEYGTAWTVKIIFHSPYQAGKGELIRFVTGAGAAPPETIAGPLRFRRIMSALDNGTEHERREALHELGPDFIPGLFDMEKSNRNLTLIHLVGK